MREVPGYDEVRCDTCGQPTPRLDPPADTELCDACWLAIREKNEEAVGRHIRQWLDEQEAEP